VAQNIHYYENYPRLVGEGGGKNFHFVHPSAEPETAVACTIRAAFEYSGQKCSSCSMLYVPQSLWESHIKEPLLRITGSLVTGHATYCDCFCSAVINRRAYDRIYMWLRYIAQSPSCHILTGGTCDKQRGYYVDTPALMGNSVLWKPSDSAILSNYFVFQAMQEAGVPKGVVNFVPAEETTFASVVTQHPKLAGINFTGTSTVLKVLWQLVAQNIHYYENYPRLVGEGGGKNFHFVHPSAEPETAVACTIRAAFEYSGQKCSSCSMLYVPQSLWESHIKEPLLRITGSLVTGHATYCDCFCSAVINRRAYDRIYMWLRYIAQSPSCQVLTGGTCDKQRGYYVDPTVVQVKDLDNIICREELLAPILGVYVYPDDKLKETMAKVAEINHGLIGSVFARDQDFVEESYEAFRFNVGSLNVNDKSTGSMVAQQPFGAGHMTGTSDKLGSPHALLRWTSPQVIKESYKPHMNIYYPYMKMNEMEQGAIHMESGQSEVVCEDKNTFEDSNKEDNRLI